MFARRKQTLESGVRSLNLCVTIGAEPKEGRRTCEPQKMNLPLFWCCGTAIDIFPCQVKLGPRRVELPDQGMPDSAVLVHRRTNALSQETCNSVAHLFF